MEEPFEIILPDGTVYKPKKESVVQGYDSDGKPKRMKFSPRTECERCGECCRRDTPVILKDDMELLRRGVISEKDIYTIREDEKIRSFIDGDTYYSSMELIKIRPIFGSSTCLFYDPEVGCTIYEMRPTVCREFECWSQNITITGLEARRLTRYDLFGSIDIIKEAIDKHEEKCSLNKFNDFVEEFASGKEENFEKIVEMIVYDNALREWIKEKLEIEDSVLPLLFGRSLMEIAPLYGILIEKEGENFIIKAMKEADR
ncbi:putative zinc- or iron-chelating domain-containing protein [Thermodesulfovibrio aggregans]|uniref:Putative zinc-or iron-chelating domain-containing protein n=1 Tax=Thermodesulfovibrio aggregans TaxID=86166 RepID=A0A0U9HXG2_9BACT|nr:YkgJ family cysteine cluster protein [Thermodesulfovibrio aggregans]GAQ95295.1 putative zinc- or iron-chelating domain-containing protein [Thermodesulfovibrio aggregans]